MDKINFCTSFSDMTFSACTIPHNCSRNYLMRVDDDLCAVRRQWGVYAVMGWAISTAAWIFIWSCLLRSINLAPQPSPKQVPCDKTRKVFADSWGIISDGPMGSNYTQDSHCEWLIKGRNVLGLRIETLKIRCNPVKVIEILFCQINKTLNLAIFFNETHAIIFVHFWAKSTFFYCLVSVLSNIYMEI